VISLQSSWSIFLDTSELFFTNLRLTAPGTTELLLTDLGWGSRWPVTGR